MNVDRKQARNWLRDTELRMPVFALPCIQSARTVAASLLRNSVTEFAVDDRHFFFIGVNSRYLRDYRTAIWNVFKVMAQCVAQVQRTVARTP